MVLQRFALTPGTLSKISYKSKVMVFPAIRPSTSAFSSLGKILIKVLEANLYLAQMSVLPLKRLADPRPLLRNPTRDCLAHSMMPTRKLKRQILLLETLKTTRGRLLLKTLTC